MIDKKTKRKLAIRVIRAMYQEIECWTPRVKQMESSIPIIEKIIEKTLEVNK